MAVLQLAARSRTGPTTGADGEGYALSFGPFRLFPAQRTLLRDELPVSLHSRALEVLTALAGRAGEVVSKQELLELVWPDTAVEEINLRVQIAALRKVLGHGQAGARYIATAAGRGYRFVAPVTRVPHVRSRPSVPAVPVTHNLPASLTRMIGRDAVVASLVDRVMRKRVVTVVGPGGIGKTTVGVALAREVLPRFRHGVRFVDLASLADGRLLSSVLAAALGLPGDSENPIVAVANHLRSREILIVLDNCEHLVEEARCLVEGLPVTSELRFLATSREPLRAAGEWVYSLSPLATPVRSRGLTVAEALSYPAVELFVERASGTLDDFQLEDQDASLVADLCRQLDGVPLAIELAAARVNLLGVRGLAAQLDDRFRLLMKGARTALPRHRTLGATLDWSYGLLSPMEQVTLRRLSVFRGGFTLESAGAVAGHAGLSSTQAMDAVLTLSDRSLVATEVTGGSAFYRLLEMTRAYFAAKLRDSGEERELRHRHAEHMRVLVEQAERNAATMDRSAWLDAYAGRVDDVRAALDWAASLDGNHPLHWTLTAAAVPFGALLSLRHEFRQRSLRALESMSAAQGQVDPTLEMRVHFALMIMSPHLEAHRCLPAIRRSLALAETLGAHSEMMVSLEALCIAELSRGDYHEAEQLASRHRRVTKAVATSETRLNSDRLLAITAHHLGDHRRARSLALRVKERVDEGMAIHCAFRPDPKITIRIWLARTLWVLGLPEQARAMVEAALEMAGAADSTPTLCYVLAFAYCPLAFWTGDLPAAEQGVALLEQHCTQQDSAFWASWARLHRLALSRRGSPAAVGDSAAIERLNLDTYELDMLATLGEGLVTPKTLRRAKTGLAPWCGSEVLRARGEELLLSSGRAAELRAEQFFLRAIKEARRQQALAWELRAVTSLARLWQRQGKRQQSLDLLAPVLDRFSEGMNTADVLQARALCGSAQN